MSNHHLGTLVGLLMGAYEMNAFKSDYQKAVISNAKAFARFLKEKGLIVEEIRKNRVHGDPPGHYPGQLWERASDGKPARGE